MRKSKEDFLRTEETYLVRKSGSLVAGTVTGLKATASGVAGKKTAIALTLYDITKDLVTGMKRTSVFSNIAMSITCSYATKASFIYVRQRGTNVNNERLTYTSNKCEVGIHWVMSNFKLVKGMSRPDNISGDEYFTKKAKGYNKRKIAVKAFLNPFRNKHSYIKGIKINGAGKTVGKYIPYAAFRPEELN